ncbi:MAG: SurA N-terminal domain-containing protein [Gammaproteobacteria bacterium]|nr:SurA N-terminal domain-containing protein [Gammaproteobacteria bacterium]
MLEFIRKRATGWVAWFIVILISIPFALWGIQEYMSPVSSLSVAKVNDTEIGLREFQQAYQDRRIQLQRLIGPELLNSIDDSRLRSETLDQMINDELVVQAAAGSGLRVGDAQLASMIQSQEAFRAGGTFSQTQYENWLRSQGYSPGGFEQIMRRDLISSQLLTGLTGSAFVTETELAKLKDLQSQRRTFRTVEIPAARFEDAAVNDAAVTAHYETNKERYARSEQVTVEYIEISRADIARDIVVDESELRRMYESRQASFVTPEQREMSHILVSVAPDAGQEVVEEARKRIDEIRDRIQAGASFEETAITHSEDPGSAHNGGKLGFIAKGIMDPEFEKAAFALEKGAVSDPVKTRFGWHLITVTDIRAPKTRSFEEMKEQIRSEIQNEQADLIYSEQVERLANLVFEHPESLEIAAETLGLDTRVSEPFSREGTDSGVAASREVVEAAFSEDVLTAHNNSGVIELADGRVIALRIRDHEPRTILPLAEVRDRVVSELERTAAREAAKDAGERLLAHLREGGSLDSAAVLPDLEWSELKSVRRDDPADPATLSVLFRMQRPVHGQPRYRGRSLPNGNFQIIALDAVDDAAPEEGQPGETDGLRQSLASATGAAVTDAYIRALRGEADIVINHENLDDRL